MSAEVELLREAATLMKILATNTTEGRWEFGTSSTVYMNGTGVYYQRIAGRPGIKGTLTMFKTDAEHMIAWDPAVARSVAALLERAADEYKTEWDLPECPSCSDGYCDGHAQEEFCVRCNNPVGECPCLAPFVTVALAFLRREAVDTDA